MEANVPYRELDLPSLALDVDVDADLERLRRVGPQGPRTQAVLEGLGKGPAA